LSRPQCQSDTMAAIQVCCFTENCCIISSLLVLQLVIYTEYTKCIEHRERVREDAEDWCGLLGPNGCVWHTGLPWKLLKCLPYWCVRTLKLPGDDVGAWRRQVNGLPRDSVLAPTLFSLQTKVLPRHTHLQLFCKADVCCALLEKKLWDRVHVVHIGASWRAIFLRHTNTLTHSLAHSH